MMDVLDAFLQNNHLQDVENIDSLLELSSLMRQQIAQQQYFQINRVICYTIEHSYYEAFSWCMGSFQ